MNFSVKYFALNIINEIDIKNMINSFEIFEFIKIIIWLREIYNNKRE